MAKQRDTYGQGYDDGKAKAHFEIRHVQTASHSASCCCEPCKTVRAVIKGRRRATQRQQKGNPNMDRNWKWLGEMLAWVKARISSRGH